MTKKLDPNISLCIGEPGYPKGRCIAICKTRHREHPDYTYEELRCHSKVVVGFRVCHLHGANQSNKGGRPPTTGRYSGQMGDKTRHGKGIEPLIQKFLIDPNWADLRKEIALLRALLEIYLEKHENDPHDEDAQKHVARMTDQIGILVDRLHKILYGEEYTINIYGIQAFAARVAEFLNSCIVEDNMNLPADDLLLKIYHGLDEVFGRPVEAASKQLLLAPLVETYASP